MIEKSLGKKILEQLNNLIRLHKEIEKVLDAIKRAKQKAIKPEHLEQAKAEISDANQYLKHVLSIFCNDLKKLLKSLLALDDAVNKKFLFIDKLLLGKAKTPSESELKKLVALGEEIKDITLRIHQAAKLEELGVLSQQIEKPSLKSIKLLNYASKLTQLPESKENKFLKIVEKNVILLKAIDLDILAVFIILDAILSHLHGRAFLVSPKNKELLKKITVSYKQAKREFADKALSVFQQIKIVKAIK